MLIVPKLSFDARHPRRAVSRLLLLTISLCTGAAAADGSPWLPEPQSGYVSMSLVHQSAGEFYRADQKRPTPGSGDLSQGTVWLNAAYALADGWSVDVQAGWAKSDFVIGPGIPTDSASFSGVTDANVGITRRLLDEATGPVPSLAIRVGGIAAGNYRTGQINSLGDGGNGYEVSAIVGKFLGDSLGFTGEVGYRHRDNDIPAENFANFSGLWLMNNVVTLGVDYRLVDSQAGLDIGAPGFTPSKFPLLEEDYRSLGVRLFFNLRNTGVNAFHARILDGRNTAASRVFGVAISRSFGAL